MEHPTPRSSWMARQRIDWCVAGLLLRSGPMTVRQVHTALQRTGAKLETVRESIKRGLDAGVVEFAGFDMEFNKNGTKPAMYRINPAWVAE